MNIIEIVHNYLNIAGGMAGSMALLYLPIRLISFMNKVRFSHKAYYYVVLSTFILVSVLQRFDII